MSLLHSLVVGSLLTYQLARSFVEIGGMPTKEVPTTFLSALQFPFLITAAQSHTSNNNELLVLVCLH